MHPGAGDGNITGNTQSWRKEKLISPFGSSAPLTKESLWPVPQPPRLHWALAIHRVGDSGCWR